VRGRFRLALGGQRHQPSHVHLYRRRTARQIVLDTRQPRLRIALSPTRNLHSPHAQSRRDGLVLHPVAGQQHNTRALRQSHAG
jgi:hypothetical protein